MAASFQQRALQRKIVYLAAVVVLFACSWLWRRNVVEASARELDLLEESRGEVDLGGSTLRIALSGARGFVTCALWHQAQDQQKKNQWSELESTVLTLTKLQPHFITPWLFQSWNLAWNVSNESDRERDKYYYIARGIQLLAVGERQNRYQPNLRRDLGMYHINRICRHDQNNVMRSLFQLSCIPPADRDPERLADFDENGRIVQVKWPEFEAFCKAHPQLVRRLHSPPLPYDPKREYNHFRCPDAKHVVEFLMANQYVPTLYVDKGDTDWRQSKPKENELERFPILPPTRTQMFNSRDQEFLTQEALAARGIPDWLDGFYVARAWYDYAQEALPDSGTFPGDNAPISAEDRGRKRVNRGMRTVIFRGSPGIAQSYIAERLQDEGWFDNDRFPLTGWFPRNRFCGPNGEEAKGGPSVVGHDGHDGDWSIAAWREANQSWQDFGAYNRLKESEFQARERRNLADAFRKRFHLGASDSFPELSDEELDRDETLKKQHDAFIFLLKQEDAKHVTNFDNFLMRSAVEMQQRTVTARKLVYTAEHLRAAGAKGDAMMTYDLPECLQAWRAMLESDDEVIKKYRANDAIQEWMAEVELKYMDLYRTLHEGNLSRDLALDAYLGQALAPSPLGADWAVLGTCSQPQLLLLPELDITGPFHRDSRGFPLIYEQTRKVVLSRHGLINPQTTPPGPPPKLTQPPNITPVGPGGPKPP